MNKSLRYTLAALAIVGFIGVATAQKKSESSLDCREWRGNDRLQNHFEIKEQTLPAGGIPIEAELPWLAVGTALDAEWPEGAQQSGRVHSFDVDVTTAGSARLRIFADLSSGRGAPSGSIGEEDPAPTAGGGLRSWLALLVFMTAASIGVSASRVVPDWLPLVPAPLRATSTAAVSSPESITR